MSLVHDMMLFSSNSPTSALTGNDIPAQSWLNDSDSHISVTQSFEIDTPRTKQKIVPDDVAFVYFVVVKCGFYEAVSLFGITTNVCNVIMFCKLGFKDSFNISLMALSISDLGSSVVLFWMGMCFNPLFIFSDVPFDTLSLVYLTGGWVRIYFTRTTSWLTAMISGERCLCIIAPLKVKTIVTRRRSIYTIIAIFVSMSFTMPPVYYSTGLDWKWYPDRNKTLLGLVFTEDRPQVYNGIMIANLILGFMSFFCVILSTTLLVSRLNQKSKWREASVKAQDNLETITTRDQRVSKMVILISAIFMTCLLPGVMLSIVMLFVPEFSKGRLYHNLFTMVWAINHITEAVNSSVNIFIYYNMSNRFRLTLRSFIICFRDKESDPKSEGTNQTDD